MTGVTYNRQMIHLYLVRHGIAEDPQPGRDDASRALTAEGRDRFRRAAKAFSRLGEPVDLLFTSPLVRAVQTAELFAEAIGRSQVEVLEELAPEVSSEGLFAALGRRVKEGQAVVVVGHDPQMTANVAAAAGLSPQEAMRIEFRKGCIVRIDVKGLPKTQPALPRWWMRPKKRELVEGLPLYEPKQPKDAKPNGAKGNGKGAGDPDKGSGGTA